MRGGRRHRGGHAPAFARRRGAARNLGTQHATDSHPTAGACRTHDGRACGSDRRFARFAAAHRADYQVRSVDCAVELGGGLHGTAPRGGAVARGSEHAARCRSCCRRPCCRCAGCSATARRRPRSRSARSSQYAGGSARGAGRDSRRLCHGERYQSNDVETCGQHASTGAAGPRHPADRRQPHVG